MAEQVVITKDQLESGGPCEPFHLKSPEWDEEREALVYEDWEATAKRLSSTPGGLSQLAWLVSRGLVPMSRVQFRAVRRDKKKMRAKAAKADVKARKAGAAARAADESADASDESSSAGES